jgi:cell division septal protein FtsQ
MQKLDFFQDINPSDLRARNAAAITSNDLNKNRQREVRYRNLLFNIKEIAKFSNHVFSLFFFLFFVFVVGLYYFSPQHKQYADSYFANIKQGFFSQIEDKGIIISKFEISGRSLQPIETINNVLKEYHGKNILAVDVKQIQSRFGQLPYVERADVRLLPPNVMQINLLERVPLVRFEDAVGEMFVSDDGGHLINIGREEFPHLPLIFGENAVLFVNQVPAILKVAPEIKSFFAKAEFISGRRWNFHLINGMVVYLPQHNPQKAWAKLAEFHRNESVLFREIKRIDLRLDDRMILK